MRKTTAKSRSRLARLGLLLASCAALFAAQAPAASAEAKWTSEIWWSPVQLVEGEKTYFSVLIANSGDTSTGPPSMTVELPAGVTWDGDTSGMSSTQFSCAGAGSSTIACAPGSSPQGANPFGRISPSGGLFYYKFAVDTAPGNAGLHQITTTLSGGGAQTSATVSPIRIASDPPGFGLDPDTVEAGAFEQSGAEFTQAGGHPFNAFASLRFNTRPILLSDLYVEGPVENHALADIVATLPPGFVGDPTAMAQCSDAQFLTSGGEGGSGCPPESQVGLLQLNAPALPDDQTAAIYNMVPPPGKPARFAFNVPFAHPVAVDASVRADGDYGITMTVAQFHESDFIVRSKLVVWGTPAEPGHDVQRCIRPNPNTLTCNGRLGDGSVQDANLVSGKTAQLGQTSFYPNPSSRQPPEALLSMPTNCADTPRTTFHLSTYQERPTDLTDLEDPRWHKDTVTHAEHTGCEAVPFDPTIDFEPTEQRSDTPTGLDVNLHFPREADSDPDGLIQAHLKKTKVTLPEGFAFNASAGDGLAGCTPEQIGLRSDPGQTPIRFNNDEPNCPSAAKVANALVTTPVLPDKLRGEVFLASQDENPFDSTFAIYITVREPSILVKLPGHVELDQRTGQITTTFDENPQLPFSDLDLDFFGGPRASLATPKTCGTFNTRTEFTPWSAADPDNPTDSEIEVSNDPFTITQGANGAGCASSLGQLPLGIGFAAGSHNPLAGQSTAYTMRITRPDGHQDLDRLELGMPSGFTAALKGVPYCPEAQIASISSRSGEAEESSPACPVASQIGTTMSGAGAGSLPLYRPGKVYLAGPYKGAPLSVVAVTPAVAGPFDLGSVVVRSQLRINPTTAQVTALTDPIPQTLEGVPLRIRDIRIAIDKPGFALNPTDCSGQQSSVRAFGANGALSAVSAPFYVRGCRNLQFKPRTRIQLFGKTNRGAYQGVRAVVRPRPGDANISRAVVRFPRSAFVAQEHIRTVCTRVQFAADACPKGSVYGRAIAYSPLLDMPLRGNVYLRSSDNLLPDAVADLRGPAHQPIKVEVAIRNDSVRGALRNTVQTAPDAPVSYFRLQMFGKGKGLIVNSRNICRGGNLATAALGAHNSRRSVERVHVFNRKCKKQRKARRHKPSTKQVRAARGKGKARGRR